MDRPTALIVEDNKNMAIAFAEALEMAGYSVDIAYDGLKAMMQLSETTPDTVLLDLHLPYAEGTEILDKIRQDSRLSHTRVIIATADAHRAKELHNRADLVLVKPIGFRQLRDLAARMLPD